MDADTAAALANEITTYEIYVLSLCTALASLSGLIRSLDDHDYRDCVHLFSLASLGGLLGLACCAAVAHWYGGVAGNALFLLGVALFVGLGGKPLEKRLRVLVLALIDKRIDRWINAKESAADDSKLGNHPDHVLGDVRTGDGGVDASEDSK